MSLFWFERQLDAVMAHARRNEELRAILHRECRLRDESFEQIQARLTRCQDRALTSTLSFADAVHEMLNTLPPLTPDQARRAAERC